MINKDTKDVIEAINKDISEKTKIFAEENRVLMIKEIKKWEEKLNGLGDDAQLANVDLQNILHKQQQTLQMMSNISKMLFDTAQSVIRKVGG